MNFICDIFHLDLVHVIVFQVVHDLTHAVSFQFAVLTGCMRISKESIFTGLNNLKVLSVADVQFDEYFGFTDSDVKNILEYYELSEHYDEIKMWYDGYRFGNVEVYCPWDVINYCDELRINNMAQPQNYWSNTSSNEDGKTLFGCYMIPRPEIDRYITARQRKIMKPKDREDGSSGISV